MHAEGFTWTLSATDLLQGEDIRGHSLVRRTDLRVIVVTSLRIMYLGEVWGSGGQFELRWEFPISAVRNVEIEGLDIALIINVHSIER